MLHQKTSSDFAKVFLLTLNRLSESWNRLILTLNAECPKIVGHTLKILQQMLQYF